MIKYCKTCSFLGRNQAGQEGCSKFNILVDSNKDFCSWHNTTSNFETCEICKKSVLKSEIYIWYEKDNETTSHCICAHCFEQLGACATCEYMNECGFRTDHTMPAYVTQNVRKGFMTMQTQVKNPNLVEKHCTTCRCSIDDRGTCGKENNAGSDCPHWAFKSI